MKKTFFEEPKQIRRIVRLLIVCCILLFALDAVIHRHTSHPWETMFGFYAVYGFVSCVILVVLAKELRKILMRPESYYDKQLDELPENRQGNQHSTPDQNLQEPPHD